MRIFEAIETRADRFIREIEKWVEKTSLHRVEPPSMAEHGSTRVVCEPLTEGNPKVTKIILTMMRKIADLLKITVVFENVSDHLKPMYAEYGF